MSARDVMAAMLDELMGPKRNVELGKDTKVDFDDPNICPYYLVGFCPHDMFTNTKADLGPCQLVHDDNMRRLYPESPEYGRLGFERRLLRFLMRLDEDNQRRIKKNRDKLAGMEDNGKAKNEAEINKTTKEIEEIEEQQKEIMMQAEKAGIDGNVTKCQELVSKSEDLSNVKNLLKEKLEQLKVEPAPPMMPPMMEDLMVKPMEVCEVCGSMLIINDAQNRIEEHMTGKMHTGFQKIRNKIEDLKESLKKQEMEDDAKREERKKDRRGGESDRKRSRSKSVEREKRRRSRSRSPNRSNIHRDHRRGDYRRNDRRHDDSRRSYRDSRDSRDSYRRH